MMTPRVKIRNNNQNSKWLIISVVAMYLGTVIFLWANIRVSEFGFDEGVHINIARLMEAGYKPYTEIFVGYPPVFVSMIYWAWYLGQTIINTRMIFVLINSFLTVITLLIANCLFGKREAFLSFFLLATSISYLSEAVDVMGDTSAVMLGTLSVLLVLMAKKQHRQWLLLGAGISFCWGMLVKFLIPYTAVVILLLLLWENRTSDRRRLAIMPFIKDGLTFAAGVILAILIILPFVDVVTVYRSTVLFRLDIRQGFPIGPDYNIRLMLDFFRNHWLLIIGSISGGILICKPRKYSVVFLGLWIIVGGVWLLMQKPLRSQHMVVLLPPLAVLAGYGYWRLNDVLCGLVSKSQGLLKIIITVLLGIIISVWTGSSLSPILVQIAATPLDHIAKTKETISGRDIAITQTMLTTTPLDCVIADDTVFLIDSNRLPPPELVEPSDAIIVSGYLTAQRFKDLVEQHDCQAIVSISGRFKELPGLLEWAKDNYLFVSEADVKTYLVKKDTQQAPSIVVEKLFENGVQLRGVDIGTGSDDPRLRFLSFYWQLTAPVADSYKVFIHLRDSQGNILLNMDRFTFNNEVPVQQWPINAVIKDTNWFTLPADLPPGDYHFFVGLYNPVTGERIPIADDTSGENVVRIGPVKVE